MSETATGTLRYQRRDQELIEALTHKVRLFSLRQIAGAWWAGDLANTRRRLRQLTAAGLLERVTVSARTLPAIDVPLCSWEPGRRQPEFGPIAYQLQQRWQGRAVRPTTAFLASQHAAQLYGSRSRGELKNASQATHDLGVSAVWLQLRQQAEAWARAWLGEDQMAETRRGEKIPDAFIVDAADRTVAVVEFGGRYDTQRLQTFHEDCATRKLPYQIW